MKIFWDTNLFIYLWEKKSFVTEMQALSRFIEEGSHTLTTSTLTLGEILVHPSRHGHPELLTQYREAMQRLALIPLDVEATVLFARLRADHSALRPADAIQISCAIVAQCDLFITNDERLSGLAIPSPLIIRSLREWEKH
ncbi:MAG: PIN domain-containing protein [Terrimicrobiaceae bacterium]|jgi:predicted nucleic acid-binding protein